MSMDHEHVDRVYQSKHAHPRQVSLEVGVGLIEEVARSLAGKTPVKHQEAVPTDGWCE